MLTVLTVPAFDDNYLWIIHDGRHAAVVDPGDAEPILAALAEHGLSLVAILLTHHHADHIGGVPRLLQHAKVPVFGPARENIGTVTRPLVEGDVATVAELDLTLSVLDMPGHTRGHIGYVATDRQWLFCGDTLFAGGCGRLFEGTPQQMCDSLAKLAALPGSTKVFCAHEYTLSNLRFALAVEPGNAALVERMALEQAKRAPFFHGKLDHVNPSKLDDPEEWRKIPILDKDMLRGLSDVEFYSKFCVKPDGGIAEYWRSGGVTGQPLFYPRSFRDIEYGLLSFARTFD